MGWQRGNGEVGIIFSMNYKLSVDGERSLPRMCDSFFSRALKIQMLYPPIPSLCSLVKPRPNHKPPCVISQQCFWPPGLMAQCSPYDMYCLKGRSALLFSSNLIPKLFKHQGFSSKYRIKSVYVYPCLSSCVCVWETEAEVKRWVDTKHTACILAKPSSLFLSCCLAFFLSPFSPVLLHALYTTFWRCAIAENESHFQLAWQIKRSIKARANVIFIWRGAINKVAGDPRLFIRNSTPAYGGHQSRWPGFVWSPRIFTNSRLGYK